MVDALAQSTDGTQGVINSVSISGFGLTTFGFLWGANDIWTNLDNIQQVTWTVDPCDCN
jgi:hypothetical protein